MVRLKFWNFLFLISVLLASASVVRAQGDDFIWQAALAKTSFMTNINADKESGKIVAGWTEIGGKLYELNVRIMGRELLRENVVISPHFSFSYVFSTFLMLDFSLFYALHDFLWLTCRHEKDCICY